MRIAICDDDSKQIAVLEAHIKAWARKNDQKIIISTFESAENFLLNWTSPSMFDILFLDIRMRKMTGMELAEVIRKIDSEMAIVFVTADRDQVFQGYEVDALHYLIKPVTEEDCAKCLSKVRERLTKNEENALVINTDGRFVRIRYDNLMYLESIGHYVHAHSTKEELRFRKNIGDLADELTVMKEFVRIHRSFLVNLRYVDSVEDNSVVLSNKEKLPISRNYWRNAHRAFVSYYADV